MRRRASRSSRAPVPPAGAAAFAAGLLGLAGAAAAEQGQALGAILQGLDKTTARVSTIEAPIGVVSRFGTLEITARACRKKPPTETPESAAFLEIVDVRPDSPAVTVFTGWMFASSPAVSAMEHPVYDVWVIDCRKVSLPDDPGVVAGAARAPETPPADGGGQIPENPEAEAAVGD
ncbi:MAG: DUF2155 domain-containing protein [Kiloniellaceae bacterium]